MAAKSFSEKTPEEQRATVLRSVDKFANRTTENLNMADPSDPNYKSPPKKSGTKEQAVPAETPPAENSNTEAGAAGSDIEAQKQALAQEGYERSLVTWEKHWAEAEARGIVIPDETKGQKRADLRQMAGIKENPSGATATEQQIAAHQEELNHIFAGTTPPEALAASPPAKVEEDFRLTPFPDELGNEDNTPIAPLSDADVAAIQEEPVVLETKEERLAAKEPEAPNKEAEPIMALGELYPNTPEVQKGERVRLPEFTGSPDEYATILSVSPEGKIAVVVATGRLVDEMDRYRIQRAGEKPGHGLEDWKPGSDWKGDAYRKAFLGKHGTEKAWVPEGWMPPKKESSESVPAKNPAANPDLLEAQRLARVAMGSAEPSNPEVAVVSSEKIPITTPEIEKAPGGLPVPETPQKTEEQAWKDLMKADTLLRQEKDLAVDFSIATKKDLFQERDKVVDRYVAEKRFTPMKKSEAEAVLYKFEMEKIEQEERETARKMILEDSHLPDGHRKSFMAGGKIDDEKFNKYLEDRTKRLDITPEAFNRLVVNGFHPERAWAGGLAGFIEGKAAALYRYNKKGKVVSVMTFDKKEDFIEFAENFGKDADGRHIEAEKRMNASIIAKTKELNEKRREAVAEVIGEAVSEHIEYEGAMAEQRSAAAPETTSPSETMPAKENEPPVAAPDFANENQPAEPVDALRQIREEVAVEIERMSDEAAAQEARKKADAIIEELSRLLRPDSKSIVERIGKLFPFYFDNATQEKYFEVIEGSRSDRKSVYEDIRMDLASAKLAARKKDLSPLDRKKYARLINDYSEQLAYMDRFKEGADLAQVVHDANENARIKREIAARYRLDTPKKSDSSVNEEGLPRQMGDGITRKPGNLKTAG